MNKIRIVFIGTPDFSVRSLESLIKDESFDIIGVVTQKDMPTGRKQEMTAPAVKTFAQSYGLKIWQPERVVDIADELKELSLDMIVVIAYAQIIPVEILSIPKFGCVNVHGSLLPKYRGAAVIQAPILNGDEKTGITLIKMNEGLDTGPILAQAEINIEADDTAGTLSDKLSNLSADILPETLLEYVSGKINAMAQDESGKSYVKKIKKADGLIDWTKPADVLERFVRAMSPWPGAWCWWKGKQIKIVSVQNQTLEINSYKPGKTIIYNSGLAVQCGKDALVIKRLQIEGKREITSEEFLRGQKDFVGSILN